MAKSNKKQDSFKEFFRKTALPVMLLKVRNMVEDAVKRLQDSVERTVSFTIKKITALGLVLFGVVFFLVGLGKIMDGVLLLPPGMGFIIIGLIVMVIGFIINTFAKR
jgi:hypothetical protein